MRIPNDNKITLEIVDQNPDAADNWIVEHVEADTIVITSDIPLAARCTVHASSVNWTKQSTQSAAGEHDLHWKRISTKINNPKSQSDKVTEKRIKNFVTLLLCHFATFYFKETS
jgi:uncharacterized protein YaiI (UPF0178 family)